MDRPRPAQKHGRRALGLADRRDRALEAGARLARSWRFAAAALAVAFAVVAAGPRPASAADSPAVFLERLSREAIARLGDDNVPAEERRARFREMLRENFDMHAIARFILGRYWRSASSAEREEFRRTLVDIAVHRFLPLFEEARRQGTVIDIARTLPAQGEEDVMIVRSAVRLSGTSEPVGVSWRIRREGDGWQIVDVSSEGVSMAIALRSEYAAVLERNGGNVRILVKRLRAMLRRASG